MAWAQEYLRQTGSWPGRDSGPVAGAEGETWSGIDMALRYGLRGLPGGSSLARLAKRSARQGRTHFSPR
jgi:hypothetical protein